VWKHILSLNDEHQVAAQLTLATDRLRRGRYRVHFESSFSDLAAQKVLGLDFLNKVIERYEKLGGELEGYFAIR
jgi:hypothetical protein